LATYLVTGCAGFIGWKVTEFLLAEGHTVVGVDNLNDAYDVRLKHWRLDQIKEHPNFTFHHLDICNREALRELFNPQSAIRNPKFDAVINLAARAGVRQSLENPWVYFETNVTGTLNLLELCREFGVKKFVLATTSSLYGANNPRPFREDANTDGPLSPYAASKKAAEALCYTYHYLYGMGVVVLRYFTVYGPAGRPDMSLFRFVQWISDGRPVIVYGDGQQSRDFTYVDDNARGTIAAVHYPQTADDRRTTAGTTTDRRQPTAVIRGIGSQRSVVGGPVFEIINLGSDRPVVLMDAMRLVEELVGKRAHIEYRPRHPADVLATWADIGKAERLLGWRPQVPFEEGIRKLTGWYTENREWAKRIATG
jgi:UDP-glucuronate 4-epimerase